jgi:hypothetical protein
MPNFAPKPYTDGTSAVDRILSDHVFASGIHKEEHSNILSYLYPQYYGIALLERLGSYEPLAADTWTWNIMDRTRLGGTATAVAGAPGSTVTITTDYEHNGGSKMGYLIENDTIRTQSGALLRVVSVGAAGGVQTVVVAKVGGGDVTADDIAAGDVFGHIANAFAEGTNQPKGRLYLPKEEGNVLQILKRTVEVTGSEFTNRTRLGDGKAWFFTVEEITMKEFQKDRELAVLFGKTQTVGERNTRGLIDYALEYGTISNYDSGSGLTERQLQDHIVDMVIEGVSGEIVVLAGSLFMAEVQRALRDYAMQGAQSFDNKPAGLNFQSYNFGGKVVHFAHQMLFDDPEVFPFLDDPDGDAINFRHFSIWLDFGQMDLQGKKGISLKYKAHGGQSRKLIIKTAAGMMSPEDTKVISDMDGYDGFKVFYLSEIGIEVLFPNRIGLMYADSHTSA